MASFLIADFGDLPRSQAFDEDHLRRLVETGGGRIFRSSSTRTCAAFPAAAPSIATAVAIMRHATAYADNQGRITLRMGLHTGPAEPAGTDFVGATLNRAERLTALAQPGQVLISSATARLVAPEDLVPHAIMEPIGRYRLRDLLEPEAIHQLRHPDLPAEFAPIKSLDSTPNNLPLLSTYCIGRNDELARLGDLLDHHRLVVITGEGGIGKTRLALQYGAEHLDRFPDGVWLIELAGLLDTGQIAETICSLLGYKIGGDRTAAEILPTLIQHKRMLIILDQCEKLPVPVAALTGALLRHCPNISLLATSRHELEIAHERVMRLGGHGLPSEIGPATGDVAQALSAPALRLLLARARFAVPDFQIDSDNVAPLGALCRALGGIALAIELIAPHLRRMSPRELLQQLTARQTAAKQDRSPLSDPELIDLLLEWSHETLAADDAVTFARFAIFGCATVDAAADIIGMSPLRSSSVPAAIGRLVDQSLLSRVPVRTGAMRYRMMTPIRDLALRKLARDAACPDVMERFCDWLIRFFNEADKTWPTTRADLWLQHYKPELDNLRAGLTWAFGPDGNAHSGLKLMSLTSELWRDIGLTVEQRHWLREAESRLNPATPDRVAARIGLDIAFIYSGGAFGDRRKIEAALDALKRYRAIGDQESVAVAAARVAVCVASPEDVTAAQPYVDLIMAALPGIPRGRRRAWLLNILAALIHFEGDAPRAITLLDEAVAISREFHDDVNIQIAGLNLGEILFAQGDAARAAAEAEAVAASCRATGNLLDLSFALSNLAGYLLVLGDRSRAEAALAEALPLAVEINVELVLVACLQSAALLAAWNGECTVAAYLAGHTAHYYDQHAIAREATEAAVRTSLVGCLEQANAQGSLSMEQRTVCESEGAAWSTSEAIEAASRHLARR